MKRILGLNHRAFGLGFSAYKALTPEQVRETAARIFSVTPTVVTVLPEDG